MALLSRRSRRRRRKTALAALAVVAAAEVGAQLVAPAIDPVPIDWPNATTDLKHEQLELLSGSEADGTNIPVIFVGDTGAQQAFLPATFAAFDSDGRLSYNAAVPGGVPAVTRPWMLEEVIPRLEPDVVVWGIGLTDVTRGYGQAEVAAYEGSLGAKDGFLAGIERSVAEVSKLVRLRPALRDPSLLAGDRRDEIVQDADLAESLLGPGGQRLGYEAGPTDIDEADARRLLGDFEIDELDVADIADTVARLRRRGKDVVLVELPTSPQMVEILPNGEQDLVTFREALAGLSESTSTQLFRAVGPFEEDDFVDFVHLGAEAAEVITGQVAAALPTLDLAGSSASFSDGANLDLLIEQVEDQRLRDELSDLSQALDAMDLACNNPARWTERADEVAQSMRRVAEGAVPGDRDDDRRFRASAVARQLSSSVAGRALLQSGCESGSTVGVTPTVADFQASTARLVASYELLDAALAPEDEPPRSRLWMHPDQVFHLEGLRDDVAGDQRPDVMVFGSSEARSGFDPELFTDLTGRSAVNLGLETGTPEVATLWIDDATEVVRPDVVVWAVSPSDLIGSCTIAIREASYTSPTGVRAQLFEGLSWAPPGSEFDLILGPADQTLYDATGTYEEAYATFEPNSRGTLRGRVGVNDERKVAELRALGEWIDAGIDCGERFDFMVDDVRSLLDRGISVVVAGLPGHPEHLALHPTGADGVLSSFQRSMDSLVRAGADYVDLTEPMSSDDYWSILIVNDDGRRVLTERLAEQLN